MSEEKPGLGLFINKKGGSKSSNAATPVGASSPKNVKKRWLYVGVGLVGLVVISSSMFGNKSDPLAQRPKKVESMVNTEPKNADKQAFTAQFGTQQAKMEQELERIKADLKNKDTQILELRNGKGPIAPDMPPGVVAPPSAPGSNTGGLGALGASPSPVVPPPIPPVRAPSLPLSVPPSLGGVMPSQPGGSMLPPMGDNAPLVFDAPERAGAAAGGAAGGPPAAAAKMRYKKNESVGMLPAGAFAPVALLNGVDAGTSTATQNNPMPILFNITDQANLPGSAKYRLKSCFVLGTAYGDMSAERVYGRISRLSCVDKADRLVLSTEVQGYLVDSDGKLGLRGMISDRQGAKLGKALIAGFAQGLAGALGQAQGTVLQNATTGTTTSAITGNNALRSAGLTGAQSATSQLADFYLKEAAAIFPVISVDAGRTGTIVFSSSVNLSWTDNDNQFVPQYTPANN